MFSALTFRDRPRLLIANTTSASYLRKLWHLSLCAQAAPLSISHSLTNFLKAVASCPLTQLLLLHAVSFIRDTVKLRLGRGLQGSVPYKLLSNCCYFDWESLLAYTACMY